MTTIQHDTPAFKRWERQPDCHECGTHICYEEGRECGLVYLYTRNGLRFLFSQRKDVNSCREFHRLLLKKNVIEFPDANKTGYFSNPE